MKSLNNHFPFFLFGLLLILANACTEPTLIGSEIIDQNDVNVQVQDTFTIKAKTISGQDRQLHYLYQTLVNPFNPTIYLIGEIEDPVFGSAKSDMYTEFFYTSFPDSTQRADGVVDSVVLILYPDSTYADGNLEADFEITVHRLIEKITDDSIYTDQTFNYDAVSIGSKQFDRFSMDSVLFLSETDTLQTGPQFRITLPVALGEELMALDTSDLNRLDDFSNVFSGLFITQTQGDEIMGAYRSPQLQVYYNQGDTLNLSWSLNANSVFYRKTNHFQHDFASSNASDFINNGSDNDSIVFLQGMNGPMAKITFPHISALKDQGVIVNKAELKLPINSITYENGYSLPYILGLSTYNESTGEFELIDELIFSLNANSLALGGAIPTEFNGMVTFNLSNTFSKMKEGDIANDLYLHILQESLSTQNRLFYSRKMVMNGADNATNPMKLVLHYTEIE